MGEKCFICGDDNQNSLQTHHIVPRRYGGSDHSENLVALCASCHQAIEKLYDDSFYRRLGVEKPFTDGSIESEPIDKFADLEDSDIVYLHPENQFYRYKEGPDLECLTTIEDSNPGEFKPIPRKTGDISEVIPFPETYLKEVERLIEDNELVRVEVEGPLIKTLERAMTARGGRD